MVDHIVEVKCHHCGAKSVVRYGGPDPCKIIRLGMYAEGWAFDNLHLALCPNCVRGVNERIIRHPEYSKLMEREKHGQVTEKAGGKEEG